jgi:hypothetical protein
MRRFCFVLSDCGHSTVIAKLFGAAPAKSAFPPTGRMEVYIRVVMQEQYLCTRVETKQLTASELRCGLSFASNFILRRLRVLCEMSFSAEKNV